MCFGNCYHIYEVFIVLRGTDIRVRPSLSRRGSSKNRLSTNQKRVCFMICFLYSLHDVLFFLLFVSCQNSKLKTQTRPSASDGMIKPHQMIRLHQGDKKMGRWIEMLLGEGIKG